MGITYGQTIKWHGLDGSTSCMSVEGYETPQEALTEALASAKAYGWTPPKWWQWWRWSEPVRDDNK